MFIDSNLSKYIKAAISDLYMCWVENDRSSSK